MPAIRRIWTKPGKNGTNRGCDGGKLTAVALMANIAARVKGKRLYDAKAQQFTNSDEANKLMTRKPRDGWYAG